MTAWIVVTVVSKSSTSWLIETFMTDWSRTMMNWAPARATSGSRRFTEPSSLVMSRCAARRYRVRASACGTSPCDNAAVSVPFTGGSRQRGALLLADITGYTAFLQGVAEAHRALIVDADEPPAAYAVLSHLLDTMVASIAPTFRLAKFEGDAIFAVAVEDLPAGPDVLECLRACYASFRERLAAAGTDWTCTCDACYARRPRPEVRPPPR